MVPKSVDFGTATVRVADGIYREEVIVNGYHASSNGQFSIVGDESVTVDLNTDPAVRITGTDSDVSPTPVRDIGIIITDCYNLEVVGILADYTLYAGFSGNGSRVFFRNCKAQNTDRYGFDVALSPWVFMENTWAVGNGRDGMIATGTNYLELLNCGARSNARHGVNVESHGYVRFNADGVYSFNGEDGIRVFRNSTADFTNGFSGTINSNGEHGIHAAYQSQSINRAGATIVGNSSGATLYESGSDDY